MSNLLDDDDENIPAFFNKVHPAYDFSNLKEDESFRKILATAEGPKRFSTPKTGAMRLGTASGVNTYL